MCWIGASRFQAFHGDKICSDIAPASLRNRLCDNGFERIRRMSHHFRPQLGVGLTRCDDYLLCKSPAQPGRYCRTRVVVVRKIFHPGARGLCFSNSETVFNVDFRLRMRCPVDSRGDRAIRAAKDRQAHRTLSCFHGCFAGCTPWTRNLLLPRIVAGDSLAGLLAAMSFTGIALIADPYHAEIHVGLLGLRHSRASRLGRRRP